VRTLKITHIILAVNVLIAIVMFFAGNLSAFRSQTYLFIRFGAQYGPLVSDGEWYRLITAIFVHGGLLHLLFNSYALYQLGHLVEGIFGQRKFLGIYFLCGLSGSVFSYFLNYQQVGVGES